MKVSTYVIAGLTVFVAGALVLTNMIPAIYFVGALSLFEAWLLKESVNKRKELEQEVRYTITSKDVTIAALNEELAERLDIIDTYRKQEDVAKSVIKKPRVSKAKPKVTK